MNKKIILWGATLLWAIFILYLTTIPNFSASSDTLLSWLIGNGGHFIFFGVEAVLIYFAIRHRHNAFYTAFFTTSIYGLVIELLQLRISGRSADSTDWAIDTLGAIIFLAIIKKYENSRHRRCRLYWCNYSKKSRRYRSRSFGLRSFCHARPRKIM